MTLDNELFVKTYQRLRGLRDDGSAGERTFSELMPRIWPLRNLADGRRPFVTNGFNPDSHKGVDMFWWMLDKDGPAKMGYSTTWSSTAYGNAGAAFYPVGTQAVAAADGTVLRAESISTGYLVTVEHATGESTGYFHGQPDTRLVMAGDTVRIGDPLFECGWDLTDSHLPTESNPVHLHFSVVRDGEYIDPEGWLQYARNWAARR